MSAIWELPWNGRHWHEMPGDDADVKKMNFYLWKMGRLQYAEEEAQIGEDGEIVPGRLRRVQHENFGKFGMTAALERKRESERGPVVPVDARIPVGDGRLVALRARLVAERPRLGFTTRLAELAEMDVSHIRKIACAGRGCLESIYGRLNRALKVMEAMPADAALARSRSCGYKDAECPEGCVPFKVWLEDEAGRQGLRVHTLRTRMMRGKMVMPVVVTVNKRRWSVRTEPAEAGTMNPEPAQAGTTNGMAGTTSGMRTGEGLAA